MYPTIRFRRTALSAALASFLLIGGCGGGGGSSTSTETTSSGTIDGTAAKGIIKNGIVTAIELDAAGNSLRTLGTTETDSTGQYSLDVSSDYAGGPIKVSITKGPNTTMVCDVSDSTLCAYGEDTALPDDFEMDSVVPEVSAGGTIQAPITPLTHMAASRALSAGTVDRDAVQAAISEVNQIVGVNILETEPVDITDATAVGSATADQQAYAAFSAGVGLIALRSTGGLSGGLQELAAAFEDGKLEATEAVTIAEIVSTVRDEAQNSQLDVGEQLSSIEARTGEDGSFDPEPLDGSGDDITKGKALMADVRTWTTSFAQFEDPLLAFESDVSLASDLFDEASTAHAELFIAAVDTSVAYLDTLDNPIGTFEIPFVASPTIETLTVVTGYTGTNSGLKLTIAGSSAVSGELDLDLTVDTSVPAAALADQNFTLSTASLSVSGNISSADDIALTLDEVSVLFTPEGPVAFTYNETTGEYDEPASPNAQSVDVEGDIILAKTVIDEATSAQVEYVFNGALSFEAVALTSPTDDNELSLDFIGLLGDITTDDGRSLSATMTFDVLNAASFDTFGYFDHDSYLEFNDYVEDDVFGISNYASNLSFNIVHGAHFDPIQNQTCFYGSSPTGEYMPEECFTGDVLQAEATIKAQLGQELSGAETTQHFWFNTDFSEQAYAYTSWHLSLDTGDFETAQSYLQANLTVATDLALPGLPDSSIVLSTDRQGLSLGVASATIVQGNVERFKLSVEADGDDGTGSAVFKNADGVAFTLAPNAAQSNGVISVDGNTVGTVSDRDGLPIIVWADGSIDSLN